jgi:uncharacterized membrane protein YbaN (DUF454 family)
MRRVALFLLGLLSLAAGTAGIVLPLVPTVPFVLLAAFCFANSSPRLEHWLVEHRRFGPHIRSWREARSISRAGKRAAWGAFAASAAVGLVALPLPWRLVPLLAALAGSAWIARLPTAD